MCMFSREMEKGRLWKNWKFEHESEREIMCNYWEKAKRFDARGCETTEISVEVCKKERTKEIERK